MVSKRELEKDRKNFGVDLIIDVDEEHTNWLNYLKRDE